MLLTVNADDFGISESVNKAIDYCFDKKLITRTTLMANMPYAEDAMRMAREKGYIGKVGLHLNLTAGRPLTEEMAANRVMCDENGFYTADFARSFKTRMVLDAATKEAVEKELRAQLDEYRALGGQLWHIDSHHHVHTDPSIWMILNKVLKDYPVSSVRLSRNMYRGGSIVNKVYKKLLNSSIKKFNSYKCGFFGSAEDYKEYFKTVSGIDKEHIVDNQGVEIMVHPLYSEDGTLMDYEDVYPLELREELDNFYFGSLGEKLRNSLV